MYFVADGGKKCELLMRVQLDKIICAQEALSMFPRFSQPKWQVFDFSNMVMRTEKASKSSPHLASQEFHDGWKPSDASGLWLRASGSFQDHGERGGLLGCVTKIWVKMAENRQGQQFF